jgi:hypothetical protein
MFYEAGIANTTAEMGVLIYLSLMERRLELIADRGVLKKVPAQDWNHQIFELHQVGKEPDPEKFRSAIEQFGEVLATHVPATGENPNELPDKPRFELKETLVHTQKCLSRGNIVAAVALVALFAVDVFDGSAVVIRTAVAVAEGVVAVAVVVEVGSGDGGAIVWLVLKRFVYLSI